jgi:hypothetical protein
MKNLPPFNKTPNPLISGFGGLTLQSNCRNPMGFVLREISIARTGNKWFMIEGHVKKRYPVFFSSFWWGLFTTELSEFQVNYRCA